MDKGRGGEDGEGHETPAVQVAEKSVKTFRHFLLIRNALFALQDLISANVNLTSFTELSDEDDESYWDFDGSLPQC